MSCRFPGGANSPEEFWELLKNKGNAISDIPPGRFNASRFVDANMEKTGNSYVGKGGFLNWNPESFDPAPFNISPREAANMDPQQRLLLILTLELFVRAGYGVQTFKDQPVGVFIGGFCVDNLLLKLGPNNWDEINAHTATGSTLTMLANRISHTFDFTGPSFSLDTACSSSLVALHQGVRSLQNGECDCAIVGGSNVIMSPEYYIAMSKGHFLSPNGRCATFDADADGYVRGEGAGLVLLKPYEQARADGDPVLGVIEASGINQDGHTPGITLPSMVAQTRLLQDLLDQNDLSPHDIGYVEAHGTGTQAGDTAETTTLKNIFADCLEEQDCLYVGSVKTNIGHLEAAAGIAGLIKSLLILQHGYLPANLHLNRFNPALAWDDRFKVPQEYIRHDKQDKKPAILVNSFGYGGTNAMVVLKRPSPPSPPVLPSLENEEDKPLALSAYSYDGLHEHVRKIQGDLQATTDVYSYLYSLNNSNADGPYRRLVWYKNKSSLIQQLDDILTEKPALPGVQNKTLALIYSGMGPHWWGMGRNLYENVPLFRETLDHVDELFQKLSGFSFIQAMGTTAQDSQIGRTEIDQPCGFGLQVALTTLLRHYGLKADCVMGHSLGEVCAFWASGWLTLEDAVCVVYHRSRLQARLRGQGGMLATALNAQEAQTYIAAYDGVCLSAQNSTNMVTLGGDLDQLGQIAQDLEKSGIFNRFLRVEVAYHSHYMDAIEEDLRRGLADISFQEPDVALYSTVSGQLFEGEVTPGDYWWGNIRQAVAFQAGFCAMIEASTPQILEIGPHPVLSGAIQENLYHLQKNVPVLYSLHREKDELERLKDILKHFYNSGFNLNWSAWYPVRSVCPVPIAPVVEKQLWVESALSKQCRFGLPGSPYLLNRVNVPGIVWASDMSRGFFPWLFDHKVKGEATFPGAGYLDAMFSAAAQMGAADSAVELHQVELRAMWLLNQDDNFTLFTKVDAATQQMELFTSVRNQLYAHQLNAVARYGFAETDVAPVPDLQNEKELDVDDFYQQVQNIGFQYGPAFQVIKQLYLGDQTLRLRLEAPAQDVAGFCYPPLLDGVFQSVLSMIITDSTYRKSYVPFSMERLCLLQPLASQLEAVVEITQMDAQEIRLNIWVSTPQGALAFYGAGIRFIALAQEPKKLMDSYACQWDVPASEQNAGVSKYALHPASSPVEALTPYLDAGADNKLLFLHDLNQPVAQIETLLFDHIKTALGDGCDATLLIVVAQDNDATGYLANMLHGLIQVLEKEGHKDGVRLVYGRTDDLLETVANWINSTQTVLHIRDKQGLAPQMTRLPDPVLSPVDPCFKRQLYFGWPLKNRLVEQGQSQQGDRLSIDVLSHDKLFGAYGFIASKGTKRYIGACTQVDKRFVDMNEEYLVEVDETLCVDTLFSALTYSVFDAVFQGKATFPRVMLHGLANKLQARAAHAYLDAYGVKVDETGDFLTCHLDFGTDSDRLEKNGIFCRVNLADLIQGSPEIWQKSVQNTLHLLETKMLPKLDFKAQDPTVDGDGQGYCVLGEAGLQVTPRLSDVMQCVLIIGGTGGFGLKMAHWLVEKGIKRVLLTSRSGQLKESQITALPSEIEVFALDVCDEQAVEKFFKRQNHRLAIDAVFHAAMVLNDQKIETLDKKAWDNVLAPKIQGAQVLDRLCRTQNIRHFVLFSSIASAIGNQHQAAYVVANRYLESLATQRSAQGFPALAVQWGAIADAGIVKRSAQLQKILASQGIEAIQSRDAFERLEYELLDPSRPVIGIYRLGKQSQTGTALNSRVAEFLAMPAQDRTAKLLDVSRSILAQVLKQDEGDFPLDRPLNNLGLDSLMVIEVLMEFETHIGLNLPSTLFMKQYSTHQLVEQINNLILEKEGA